MQIERSKSCEEPRPERIATRGRSNSDETQHDNAYELRASRHKDVEREAAWVEYEDERQLSDVMRLVDNDLSEPYSIFTYRYFVRNWPKLCLLAKIDGRTVAAVISKAEIESNAVGDVVYRGYIAMLAVDSEHRRYGIGTALVCRSIERMKDMGCEEVMLETEVTNHVALTLYEKLGFARDERLFKYYLNGIDAYRLKLWFSLPS
ncbi:acyl-CoA N-acyltransferase [Pelagophyceae sp. CCMP2097]|nr:acyl-CoA N-acyltransferase [Pelagophyceae sp. CCMP2097]